ncbi:unnamed protein product [Schistocephalus solidus]|uniref:BHLH domain-containing protein n=1 Tax=Schistocephalus solidus TaxID=70667 RepID=A0A183SEP3_SCHSO|nr:unnamed protein product [Schistocephalus solidus]
MGSSEILTTSVSVTHLFDLYILGTLRDTSIVAPQPFFDLTFFTFLRRDHHNHLERKRRASIKGSYSDLREAIPGLRGSKASRAVTLQRAVEYIEELHRRNREHTLCVDTLTRQNEALDRQACYSVFVAVSTSDNFEYYTYAKYASIVLAKLLTSISFTPISPLICEYYSVSPQKLLPTTRIGDLCD